MRGSGSLSHHPVLPTRGEPTPPVSWGGGQKGQSPLARWEWGQADLWPTPLREKVRGCEWSLAEAANGAEDQRLLLGAGERVLELMLWSPGRAAWAGNQPLLPSSPLDRGVVMAAKS